MLYHAAGNSKQAVRKLQEPKQLCADQGIPFEGDRLLQEYMAERSA
jgi:hypothetical protein